ncbi:BZ3500_MvSof-1268-A1-R1_Chr6-3g09010 [Microbotryum saponariae]|uniref:BZ3500_MvSof-1268-A1-R1_Chr6-3g09010 protein n=1 Tax=Microbotryum saponariae TaxID=289078 RepID=A0A2X0NI96_9BASI|nr:BZ3500_MvSof-1268-A1-R1_Chr6-3g09010 [Microbotryum saponariae]SDA07612.1 BZ3501_MvSof-1269-A2-R1_Chr6-2g08714 [Microbotryum saponariae]
MPPKRRYKSKPSVYKLQGSYDSSTAPMPMAAFSFRLVEQAHASWKVSPRTLTGYADGLKEYYSRCEWGRGHYTGHTWVNLDAAMLKEAHA